MPYSYPEIKQLKGLYLQRNSFTVPDGALEQATNLTVKNDNVLSSRRGFHQYYNPSSGTLNNLFEYQDNLIAMFNAKLERYTDTGSSPNETGSETAITGETILNSNNRISRNLKANSNMYMTTDNGVIKMTAYNSNTYKSGAPQGLDLGLRFKSGTLSTFLGSDKIVGYRVVFGYRDANDNLILGAPSQIANITNTLYENASWSRTSNVVTVTYTAHGRQTGDYISLPTDSDGTNFVPAGQYQITVTGANTFTFSHTDSNDSGTDLDFAVAMPVRLELSIPSEISTDLTWFYQVYRSSQQTSSVGIFSDFKLITEEELTSAEISAGLAYFDDDIDDILLGAELYTNENSREGELQANFRPPLCDDVTFYKGHAIYAKCTTRHLIDLAIIDTTVISATDYIEVRVANDRRYVAQSGVANRTVRATMADDGGGDIEIGYTAHGFANGDSVYIDNVTGTLAAGTYYVINTAANTFEISLTKGGSAVAWTDETYCEVQGVTEGTGDYPMFYLSSDASASVRLRDTAEALCKAMNRDSSAEVYAEYTSGINDIPGKIRLQEIGFGNAISLRGNTTTVGSAFSPSLPSSFSSGTQVTSTNENLPHVYYASKEGEPEAVPLVNFFPVGSKNAQILRCAALRDSLILLKEDGVWRITGDSPNNFTATLLDGTVVCVAANSVDIINNQVGFLSNQGVCFVTESTVQIISREGIEDPVQPILGQSDLANQTSGLAYESDRLYLLTTTQPNDATASITYAYNIITQEWSTWDRLFIGGVVGPGDKLYYISTDNDIQRERKNQDRTDFADQNHTITLDAIDSDTKTLTFTMTTGTPQNGDMIIKNNVITRIDSDPELLSGNQYSATLDAVNNLEAADTPILYSRFARTIKLAPFHAGLVGRLKFFAQMSIHMRDNGMSKCTITFTGQTYGGSTEIEWNSQTIAAGWGNFPWGFEPWGQETGINLTTGTQPAPVVRIYVPPFQARNTFIQPIINHIQAGEPTNIQAFSFAVRPYGERLTI